MSATAIATIHTHDDSRPEYYLPQYYVLLRLKVTIITPRSQNTTTTKYTTKAIKPRRKAYPPIKT